MYDKLVELDKVKKAELSHNFLHAICIQLELISKWIFCSGDD